MNVAKLYSWCRWISLIVLITHVILGWYLAIPILNTTQYKEQIRKSSKSTTTNFLSEYEIVRRDLSRFQHELWTSLKKSMDSKSAIRNIMHENYIESMASSFQVKALDGFNKLRYETSKKLSLKLQQQLEKSQNPQNCQDARYLVRLLKIP